MQHQSALAGRLQTVEEENTEPKASLVRLAQQVSSANDSAGFGNALPEPAILPPEAIEPKGLLQT